MLYLYNRNKGDVTLILESIILSENEDVDRFVALIEEKIQNGELKKYKNWDKTKDKIVLLPDESEEVKKQEEAEFKDLAQNILAKYHKNQTNMFDALEKKYGGGGKKGKKGEYDIDEETFQKIQNGMMNKDKDNTRKKVKK